MKSAATANKKPNKVIRSNFTFIKGKKPSEIAKSPRDNTSEYKAVENMLYQAISSPKAVDM